MGQQRSKQVQGKKRQLEIIDAAFVYILHLLDETPQVEKKVEEKTTTERRKKTAEEKEEEKRKKPIFKNHLKDIKYEINDTDKETFIKVLVTMVIFKLDHQLPIANDVLVLAWRLSYAQKSLLHICY